MTGIHGFVVADRGLLARGAGPKTPAGHYKPGRAAISIIEYGGSDSASGVEECGQATVSKGIRRNPAIRAGSGGYWGSLAGVVKDGGRRAWQRRQRGRGKQWLKTEDGARWTDAEADQGVRLGVVPASE